MGRYLSMRLEGNEKKIEKKGGGTVEAEGK